MWGEEIWKIARNFFLCGPRARCLLYVRNNYYRESRPSFGLKILAYGCVCVCVCMCVCARANACVDEGFENTYCKAD